MHFDQMNQINEINKQNENLLKFLYNVPVFQIFFQLFFVQALIFATCSMKNTYPFNIYIL